MKANVLIPDITIISKETWIQERKKGIGGSDVGAILGLNKYKSMFDVFYEKIGVNKKPDSEKSKISMEIGNRLEDFVADIFQERYPAIRVQQDNAMYQHTKYPFMLANIDRRLLLPDGTQAILGCKTLVNATEWVRTDFCKGINGVCPLSYEYQVRHYMATLDIDLAFVVGLDLTTKDLYVIYIPRDRKIEQQMIAVEIDFWSMVEKCAVPTISQHFQRLCTAIKADTFKRFYGANKELVYEIKSQNEKRIFNEMNECIIRQQFHNAEAQKAKEEKEEIAMKIFVMCEKQFNMKPSRIEYNDNIGDMSVTQYVALTDTTAVKFDLSKFITEYNSSADTKLSEDIDEKTAIIICGKNMPERIGEFFSTQDKGARFYFSIRKTKQNAYKKKREMA